MNFTRINNKYYFINVETRVNLIYYLFGNTIVGYLDGGDLLII